MTDTIDQQSENRKSTGGTIAESPPEVLPVSHAQSRLLISIPALMTVFTLGMGLGCYLLFASTTGLDESQALWLRGLLVGGSILAAISGYVLAWTIVTPLRRFETRLRDMAMTGQVQALAGDAPMAPEIGQLGRRFDQVLASLDLYVAQRNRYILECFTGGLVLLDRNGIVTMLNNAAISILGPEAESLPGRPLENWLRVADAGSAMAEAIRMARRERVYVDSREMEVTTPSKTKAPIILTINALGEGEGDKGLAINFRDLTAYQQFYEQMDRADRLAAIGTFAAGIAHEIRNPLGSIKGMAQLLAEDLPADRRSRQYADVIVRETDRLNLVVRSLLDFTQPGPAATEFADLNRLMSEALTLSRGRVDADHIQDIVIIEDYSPIRPVWVQPDRVIQALVNIIRNAIEAVPPGGTVRLTSQEGVTESGVAVIEARISNNGPVIPPEEIPRIFEPFYTSKEGGTGLGLPISSQIVTSNGGQINVESHPGETTFTLRFPAPQ